eukprot:2470804-Rhodomonas_salina.4
MAYSSSPPAVPARRALRIRAENDRKKKYCKKQQKKTTCAPGQHTQPKDTRDCGCETNARVRSTRSGAQEGEASNARARSKQRGGHQKKKKRRGGRTRTRAAADRECGVVVEEGGGVDAELERVAEEDGDEAALEGRGGDEARGV